MTDEGRPALAARVAHYCGELFDEDARLTRTRQGPLEFERTLALVRRHLPRGRVLDVGGGTGRYARALLDAGYEVQLVDPVPRHVEAARGRGVRSRLGDARALDEADDAADGVLLLGPLYHLASADDRIAALREAGRVTRPGGVVFAAAVSRFVALGKVVLGAPPPAQLPGAWAALLTHGVDPGRTSFPAGHLHTAEELEDEVAAAGLLPIEVVGVEGPGGLLLESVPESDDRVAEAARVIAEAGAAVPGFRDLSAHLLAVARVP